MLVIEPDGVHHLMLDMTLQMRTPPQVYGLTYREGVKSHSYPAGASSGIFKSYIVRLGPSQNPL